ncbi:LysR family transcriptional regulator [Microbaculum marinum]|uniref:LysR family transcriptional regulator n=1 Tax=Microbaculum marinum TaxID=1764581 RepID=A0AAW9RQZ0_9HYPH
MIKLEALRVFITVAEVGNIKDAADRLGRTASAISMTLKQLEEEVGGPLFATDRKSSLTALGRFILDTAQVQLRSYDKSIARIRAYAQNRIGRLSVAAVPSVATHLLPALLPRFVAERPGLEVELFDIDSRSVQAMVEADQADLGLAGEPVSDALTEFTPLFRDRFKVVCAEGSPLCARPSPLRWSDLAGETLIRNGASEAIQSAGYRAKAARASLTVHNVTSLVALARAGLGITLLPALATVGLPEGAAALELRDGEAQRTVGLLERRGAVRSPVASAFREVILAALPDLVARAGVEPIRQRPVSLPASGDPAELPVSAPSSRRRRAGSSRSPSPRHRS